MSLAGYLRLPPRIGVRYPPTGRRATSTMFPPFHTCKFRCSPSGHQPAGFADWSVTHLTPCFHKHDICTHSNRFECPSSVDARLTQEARREPCFWSGSPASPYFDASWPGSLLPGCVPLKAASLFGLEHEGSGNWGAGSGDLAVGLSVKILCFSWLPRVKDFFRLL